MKLNDSAEWQSAQCNFAERHSAYRPKNVYWKNRQNNNLLNSFKKLFYKEYYITSKK